MGRGGLWRDYPGICVPAEPLKAGDMVEGFRVMAELGRGAASIIYLAQDVKTQMIWALKHVTKDTPKDQRFLDQAEQEYEIASQLNHPSLRKIVKIIKKKQSLLSVSDLWLVMECVDGTSLESDPPETFEEAASVFKQVATGLAYMHARGFVHADMKPNNIIVDEQGRCKIIDLGQSCKTGTTKERIQGTPDYIAPEQVHRRPITEKTDIYNLGATMYKVLTRTFVPTALAKGDSLLGSKDDNLMQRPKQANEINRRIPEMLNRLIMECIEVDASKRPASMEEVADRLDLIHAKLLAEQELRKSGMLPRFDDPGRSHAGGGGGGPSSPGGSGTGMRPASDGNGTGPSVSTFDPENPLGPNGNGNGGGGNGQKKP
jgi:serine/threonine-protein kinase